MKVAVVILNWNGVDMLRKYLPTVISHTNEDGVEVVVADNGSTDDSVSMMQREFPDIRLVILDENFGFAEGYNRALRDIDADYLLLLNSDVEIKDDGWLSPLISFMDAHPDVAACQPKIRSLAHPDMFEYAGAAGGFIDRYGFPFCRGRVLGCVEQDSGQYDDVSDVFWATGAALMVRSKDYWAVGGLDGRFFAHMEEIDFCWRLKAAGRRIVCVPQSRVYHLGGASLHQGNPRKTFLNFRNNLMMLHKNLPADTYRSVMRMRRLIDFTAALQFLAKLDIKNCVAVFKARKAFYAMREELDSDRHSNLSRAVVAKIPEQVDYSILWQYFVRRRKTFTQLQRI